MKLTPRAQGCRYRRSSWPETRYIYITKVGKGFSRRVEGTDQNGRRVVFGTNIEDNDWVRIGSTRKFREGKTK